MTRFLLFLINEKDWYEFDRMLEIYMKITIFDEDEKNILNLCFKTVFIKIKKIFIKIKKIFIISKRKR